MAFVSRTSESDAEKAALKRVVEQVNGMLEKTRNVTLRLIGWPDSIRPGVNTDPQMEITRQLNLEEYDIYVGILGSRFGTMTPRAGSGTQEEFENALSRFQRDTRSLRVLFYFNRALQDPFSVDLEQLQRVREFRDRLPALGVLFRDFKDTTEFVEMVTNHLYHLVIDEWQDSAWVAIGLDEKQLAGETQYEPSPPLTSGPMSPHEILSEKAAHAATHPLSNNMGSESSTADENEDDELGLLDLMEEFHRAIGSLTVTMEQMGEHTAKIGERLQVAAGEATRLAEQHTQVEHVGGSRAKQDYLARAKEVVNRAAGDLERYATDMSPVIIQFRTENRAMFANLRQALVERKELNVSPEEVQKDREALVKFIELVETTREQATSFQSSIASMPALTGRFKRARKQTTGMLGDLIAEVSFLIEEGRKILPELNVSTSK
jgi:uncharacterized protein DUF4062